jgi:hypothetical protein
VDNIFRLAHGEFIEIVLPNGNSVWVFWDGKIQRTKDK